jgi:hypothetical protein
MALVFDNCLAQQGSGTNFNYGNCCYTIDCLITNNNIRQVEITDLGVTFQSGNFSINSIELLYQGSPVSVPFFVDGNTSFQFVIDYCAPDAGLTDSLSVEFLVDRTNWESFVFDFEAIDLSTSIDVSSIDFGIVNVNSNNQFQVVVNNPTIGCYTYGFDTDCADLTIDPNPTPKTCFEQTAVATVNWNPTTIGVLNCVLQFGNDCQLLEIPITGEAIQPPPSSGGRNDQKNKVDQITRVEACSPRTVNNRCQTAQSMQSAIRTNARRFGKR